jgi:hypothetical protein
MISGSESSLFSRTNAGLLNESGIQSGTRRLGKFRRRYFFGAVRIVS